MRSNENKQSPIPGWAHEVDMKHQKKKAEERLAEI